MSKRQLPETSIIAKNTFTDEIKQAHHAKILYALDKLGAGIYTDIASVCGLEPHAVARRLKELEPASPTNPKGLNKVWKPGAKKNTPPPSNRPAFIYQLIGTPAKTEKEQNIYRNKGVVTAAEHAKNILAATQPEIIQQSLFNL